MLAKAIDIIACPQDLNPSYCTVIKKLAAFYLSKKDPKEIANKDAKIKDRNQDIKQDTKEDTKQDPTNDVNRSQNALSVARVELAKYSSAEYDNDSSAGYSKRSRYIPVKIKQVVHVRANHQCEYQCPETKQRCTSTHALQIEHIIPHAVGGANSSDNLQLICSTHNSLRAIQFFGIKKMSKYITDLND